EVERRHADLQPGPQRDGPLEEPEEPLRLRLPALAGQHRRGEALVVLVVLIAHQAAALLDDVAVAAAVPEHQPLALEHRHLLLALAGEVLLRGTLADLTFEEGEDGERFLV